MLLDKVKKLCSENKITIAELEKTLKFGNGTISKWEFAQPSVTKVRMVGDYFNVGIDFLVYDEIQAPAKESIKIAMDYQLLTDSQKALVKSYILLFKNGQVLKECEI